MRIAFFSEVFLPKVDGIVNTLCRLLDFLTIHGHECLVIAPSPAPMNYGSTRVLAVPSTSLPFYPEIRLASPWFSLDEALNAFRPDLVHIVNPVALGLIGFQFAKKQYLPVVASYHTDLPGFATRWGLGSFNQGLWFYLRSIHNLAGINFCPSQATLDELAQHGFQRLKVWSRGVDSQLFHPQKNSIEWRWRLSGGEPEKPLLLFTGRLSAEKRITWLVDVLKALPEVRLAIVGDGPQRLALETAFKEMPVLFTGYLKGEDLAAAYASSDLFVFPAANETFGNVVLEAMSSGLPVITPHSGGPLDFVTHGKHGLLFETEEIASLVQCVRQIIADPDLAQMMGQESRLFAEHRDWGEIFHKLLVDYQRLVDQKSAAIPKTNRTRVGLPTLDWR